MNEEAYQQLRTEYYAHIPCTDHYCSTCSSYQLLTFKRSEEEQEKLKQERFAKLVADEVAKQLTDLMWCKKQQALLDKEDGSEENYIN